MCPLKWHLDAIKKSTYVPFGFSSSCPVKGHLGSHWSKSSIDPTLVHARTSFACFFRQSGRGQERVKGLLGSPFSLGTSHYQPRQNGFMLIFYPSTALSRVNKDIKHEDMQ